MTYMTITRHLFNKTAGPQGSAPLIRKWGGFFLCMFLLWFFMFVFAPWLAKNNEYVGTLGKYIRESGIDAGAVYYTEVEEVGDADQMIRDTFRFYLPHNENTEP